MRLSKPIVAAVNGVAAGAGMSLALACDIVLAAESASFLQAFARIGLVPDCGSTWMLPRLVGDVRARALTMLADKIGAADALRYLVLVNETVGEDWLDPRWFRFGASSLLNDLLLQRQKLRTGHYSGPDYVTLD